MGATVYVPQDAGALSLGAEEVARAITAEAQRRATPVQIVRNGSRGAYWPVNEADVASLFNANFLSGGSHPLGHGPTDSMEWLKGQQRLTFQRVGIVNPASVEDYVKYGGYQGLKRALGMAPAQIVQAITASGLRGRGGAAFPTGIKWKTVHDQQTAQKYVTCNADEGDSGTFADRMLMEGDPLTLIEGMTIAGIAVGATQGYIYLRAEYPHAYAALNTAIRAAGAAGYLGPDVAGSGKRFELEVRLGAGAYICGEETSMLESLEGKRGEIRVRPPLPAIKGLFGQPTIVNNVVTLSTVPWILANGAEAYAGFGMGKSRGTLPIQLAGNILRGGLVERAFGLTLKELLYDYGGGTASGRPIRTVQVGGPLGAYIPPAHFDTAVDYEALSSVGALLGHGGIVVFDDTVDMARMARYAMEFCALESCGKCTPCRIGSTRGVEVLDRILAGIDGERNVQLLEELCDVMVQGSLCGLGGMAPFPVQSALKHFREDFRARSN
jgi:formate dehydrogenase iron-sulfur subunit